jgi:hypothetical protein
MITSKIVVSLDKWLGKRSFFLKCHSIYGLVCGVDLVRCMQPGGDLHNCWLMFNHVKCVQEWTTMACHVYNLVYYKVFTIIICDMKLEST